MTTPPIGRLKISQSISQPLPASPTQPDAPQRKRDLLGYWNEEHGEIKYQIGEGCAIDQVLAGWHANLCGLGEIFDKDQTVQALKAIYRYNFKKSLRDVVNPCWCSDLRLA